MENKRGNTLANTILFFILIILGIIGFMYANSAIKGDASRNAAEQIVTKVVDVTIGILNSTIGLLIGTTGLSSELAFLRIIVFVLISIIIVGTFDSINIFGDDPNSKWTNLIVGIIVAVIGVRFMPNDMWQALTAPSSALVFAIMMGLPLVALMFVITKIRVEIIRKVIVAAYIIGVGWLFFLIESQTYRTLTLIFLAVALLLLLFDAQFVRYVRSESTKTSIAKLEHREATLAIGRLKRDLKDAYKNLEVATDANSRAEAKEVIKDLNQQIKDLSRTSSA